MTELGYEVQVSLDGEYYKLCKDDNPIIADSANEDLYSADTAEAYFNAYGEEYVTYSEKQYDKYIVRIIEDTEYYHIDFRTGYGESHYKKADWTLSEALEEEFNQ